MMIMNEKIGKIKLELLKEEFIKQIKDSYTLNLSMVLLEEFENLQQENQKYKEVIDKAIEYIRLIVSEEEFIETEHYTELLDILKEVDKTDTNVGKVE